MDNPDRPDPRIRVLAAARQDLAADGSPIIRTWDRLHPLDQKVALHDAERYLTAAIRAGLIPSDTPPTEDHMAVWVDEEGFVYSDYPTEPGDDYVVQLVTANAEAESRRDLEGRGATFTRIGWCK